MKKLSKIIFISVASVAFGLVAGQAAADHALLDLLVRKGILTRSEASSVERDLEAKTPLKVKAKGKETVELRFNGRLHGQYDALTLKENGKDKDDTNHFYFRRLRVGVKAKLQNGIYAETVLDLTGNDYSTDKAFAGYKFSDAFDLKFGYDKVPFGFEETASSAKIQTIERSATNRFFADDIDFSGRHMGLHVGGEFEKGFSYAASLVNAPQGEDSRLLGDSNSSNDMAFFSRLQWEGDLLTVGVDGGIQPNNEKIDKSYNGDFRSGDVIAWTGYVNYKKDGLDVLGEYFEGDLDAAKGAGGYVLRLSRKFEKFEPVFRYAYLETDLFGIDGDELIRRGPKGGFLDAGSFNGKEDDGSTSIDFGSHAAEIESLYFGLNYYHSPSVKFMLGYEMAKGSGKAVYAGHKETPSVHDRLVSNEFKISGFRGRLQVLW